MNSAHYCKICGHNINFSYGEETSYCPICNKEITRKDAVRGWTRDARAAQLKAMHELISNCNDEMIYGSWIYTMPDGATDEDFNDIALNEELYNECFDKFLRLVKKDGMRW